MNTKLKMLLAVILVAAVTVFLPITAVAEDREPRTLSESTEPALNLTKLTLPAHIMKDGTKYTAFTWLRVPGITKDVKWKSSNKNNAIKLRKTNTKNMIEVDAQKKGKATVIAKIGKKKLKCKVTVTAPVKEEELFDMIKVDMSNADKQYMTVTNTSDYHVIFDGDTHFYDANNELVVSYSIGWIYLAPGETRKVYSECSNYPSIDHCEFVFESAGIDYEYHPLNAACEIKEMEGNLLPVVVTNNSDYTEGLYEVTAFFLKDSEVVWAEHRHTDKTLEPGASATIYFGIYDHVPEYDEIVIDVQR